MWWKKVSFRNYFIIAVVLSIISIAGILLIKNYLPPIIPLYYGKPTGADQLAPTLYFLIIPGVSILISGINLIINLYIKDEFVKKVLAVSSLLASIMATITIVKIVFLIGLF